MSIRAAVVACALVAIAVPAGAVDPPVIRPGECLYLLGAPPGAPAATTEVSYDGVIVRDHCSQVPHAEIGRDAPHRITTWMDRRIPLVDEPRGCQVAAFAENEFAVLASDPAWIQVSASGTIAGQMGDDVPGVGGTSIEAILSLVLEQVAPDGTAVSLSRDEVRHHVIDVTNQLLVDDSWSGTVSARVAGGGLFRIRLAFELRADGIVSVLDFGTPGSGRGVGFDRVSACVMRLSDGGSTVADDLERDLYDRRCMPMLWLPSNNHGRLDDALMLVSSRIEDALNSGESGTNIPVARARVARATTEIASGQYQHACRSLSDALHALTTP